MKLIVIAMIVILTGCVVLTENLPFSKDDSVITEQLSGEWFVYTDQVKGEQFKFIPQDDASYKVEIYDTQGKFQESNIVRFAYINSVLCGAMISPDKNEYAIITVHLLKDEMHVKGLSVQGVDQDITAKKIPFRTSFISGTVTNIKLHGTTEELHAYLTDRVHKSAYWTEPIIFKRT